jgi:hypothetical protein
MGCYATVQPPDPSGGFDEEEFPESANVKAPKGFRIPLGALFLPLLN